MRESKAFREPPYKHCAATGKFSYAGQAFARIARNRLMDSKNFHGGVVDVYHCTECDGWHVGHAQNQDKRSLLKRLGVL